MRNCFLTEKVKIVNVLVPVADRFNSNPDTTPIDVTGFEKILYILQKGAGDTGTTAIVAKVATDSSKTSPEAIPFRYKTIDGDTFGDLTNATTAGITNAAGADKCLAIEIDTRDFPENKTWLYLDLTESVDSPVTAGIIAVCYEQKYDGVSKTVLS